MPNRRWPWMLPDAEPARRTAAILLDAGYLSTRRNANEPVYAIPRPVCTAGVAPAGSQISGFPPPFSQVQNRTGSASLLRLQPRFSNDHGWLD